ncbi:hypothetical protein [Thauera humireducens]|uniref:hypothetical protein n=1 Tax=Thauera humireducens TaxID=1134435 RepID=UPI00311D9199
MSEQVAGGTVGVEDELVAGDDQAFVDELEQCEIDASLRAFGKVGYEGFGRRWRAGRASWNVPRAASSRRMFRIYGNDPRILYATAPPMIE